MEAYKASLYRNYRTRHNQHLYGDISIEKIRSNYPVWNYYYGSHLPSDKNAQILEIGCGDGGFIQYLNDSKYNNAFGLDLSEEQISVGHKLGIKNIALGEAKEFLARAEGRYDLIIARDVIEHFTRQEAFDTIVLINHALKRNGKLIMQVPNGQGIFHSSIFFGDFTHEMAYTTSSVRQLFLNAGFESSKCFPTGPVPCHLSGRVRKILWDFKVLTTKFWKMVETGNPSGIFTSNLIAVGNKS